MRSTQLSRVLGIVTFVVFCLAFARPASAQSSTLYSLKEFENGTPSKAYSINNTGQIVGWVTTADTVHAAHWLNDHFTDLHGTSHLALDQIFTVSYGEAYAISNADQIVGTARTKIKCDDEEWIITNAFILSPAVNSDLGTPFPGDSLVNLWTFGPPCSAHNSAATDISNANHVVGWADVDGAGTVHAFLLRPVGGVWFRQAPGVEYPLNELMIDLGTLDLDSVVSSATAVNDNGFVTGYSYVGEANTLTGEAAYHAFLVVPQNGQWYADADADGVNDLMIDLGTLGGNNSWGRGINNAGQVVGESDTADGNTHAFLWQNGAMTDLGTLGGANSSAAAINANGDIVGWAEDANGKRHAVRWRAGQIMNLNSSLLATQIIKSDLSEARDVNNSGEIVGWGKLKGAGQEQAVLLKAASAAQIAAHNDFIARQNENAGGGSSDGNGGSTGDGRGGGASTVTPLIDGDAAENQNDDNNSANSPLVPISGMNFGLCGTGSAFSLAMTLAGLVGLRSAARRR